MQEHVELEVSLEIIMSKIADEMFNLKEDDTELMKLIELEENAYSGNRSAVEEILNINKGE